MPYVSTQDIYDIFILYYLCFWAAIFGLCAGSFINVVIYRLPKGIPFTTGRSACVGCGKQLSSWELIPVLSFIMLRGRCRHCKAAISLRYPLVEGLAAVAAVMCCLRFGLSAWAVLAFLTLLTLLAVAFIDADTMTIPDSLNVTLAVFAIVAPFVSNGVSVFDRVIGLFAISLPMLILALVIQGGAFGGGDIKLMAVCGFLLGWKLALTAFFIAVLTGGTYAFYLLLRGKRGLHIAFGPYLCAGLAVSMFFGGDIIRAYLTYLNLF